MLMIHLIRSVETMMMMFVWNGPLQQAVARIPVLVPLLEIISVPVGEYVLIKILNALLAVTLVEMEPVTQNVVRILQIALKIVGIRN